VILSCTGVSGSASNYWAVTGAGTGTWDTGGLSNWSYNLSGSPTTTWTNNDDAVFSASNKGTGNFVVTVDAAGVQANSITVGTGTPTFSGGTITLTGTGGTMTITSAAS